MRFTVNPIPRNVVSEHRKRLADTNAEAARFRNTAAVNRLTQIAASRKMQRRVELAQSQKETRERLRAKNWTFI